MENYDHITQRKQSRSFARDMQQAFLEWIRALPFVKRDVPGDFERDDLIEKSADQASVSGATNGALEGPPPDNELRREPVPAKHVFAPTSSVGRDPMSEEKRGNSAEPAPEIRIERLNSDKTRKDVGWDTVYHVYFELTAPPAPEWRNIFAREWTGLNTTREASIDGAFLVLHCQLHEVATTLLPALKKAVAATNEAYTRYALKEATELEKREDVWKEERQEVDAMASSLRFD